MANDPIPAIDNSPPPPCILPNPWGPDLQIGPCFHTWWWRHRCWHQPWMNLCWRQCPWLRDCGWLTRLLSPLTGSWGGEGLGQRPCTISVPVLVKGVECMPRTMPKSWRVTGRLSTKRWIWSCRVGLTFALEMGPSNISPVSVFYWSDSGMGVSSWPHFSRGLLCNDISTCLALSIINQHHF